MAIGAHRRLLTARRAARIDSHEKSVPMPLAAAHRAAARVGV
jgi:hypothetical protein